MPNEQSQQTEKDRATSLEAISPSVIPQVSVEPDAQTREEREDLESERARAQIAGIRQDIEQRKEFAKKIFRLVCVWLIVVFAILLFQGFHLAGFDLGQPVLLAVIGSTTINIIGLFYVVAHYLFPNKK